MTFQRFAMLTALSLAVSGAMNGAASAENQRPLSTVAVQTAQAASSADNLSLDAVVEAVRQTTLSAQVPGAIVALRVKVGDTVKVGQELLRIDASAASQNASASEAQVQAAQASLNVASKDFERQQQLFQKQYISQAALDRAQAQWLAAQAQVRALQAQAGAARTQSGFFTLNAPYAGVVSDVPVTLGDMVMPGRPLVTMHDPAALRVTAAVPQSALAGLSDNAAVRIELPGLANGFLQPTQVQVLPVVDAATHTAQVRLGLPANVKGAAPGTFARVWLPLGAGANAAGKNQRLYVPASSVVRRGEMTGLYIVNAQGLILLRQVRLGAAKGALVEILSGVSLGEQVATDPQAASRQPESLK